MKRMKDHISIVEVIGDVKGLKILGCISECLR